VCECCAKPIVVWKDALQEQWQAKAANIVPVEIAAKRTQIRVTDLRLVWIPVG
jgi:hypothetical protein